MPNRVSIKMKEMIKDAKQIMQYKNKRKRTNIILKFEGEIFDFYGDYERIYPLICNILQITID